MQQLIIDESQIYAGEELIKDFKKGELTIISTKPGGGKTELAINIALNISNNNAKVGYFCLEMDINSLLQRVDRTKARLGLGNLSNISFHADYSDLDEILNKCNQLSSEDRLDFIVIDYLQLIDTSNRFGSNRRKEGYILDTLKEKASEASVTVLLLSQLPRG